MSSANELYSELGGLYRAVPASTSPVSDPIFTVAGKVACTPFPSTTVEKEVRGGMVVPKQRNALEKLQVVFSMAQGAKSSPPYAPGWNVWLSAELFVQNWAKCVLELDGKKFILVPEEYILLCRA